MMVLNGSANASPEARGAMLAIGNFDGVHRGHQAVLAVAVERARGFGKKSGVMLFEPHPRAFFAPLAPHFRLTSLPDKLEILARLKLDVAVVLAFDARLAGLSPDDFVAQILVGDLAVSGVVIGHDFFFGRGRKGSPETLVDAGRRHGFTVTVVDPVAEGGQIFSSSAVRLALAQGDVTGARGILGRPWLVAGTIVGGNRRGTELGFPTANVPMPKGTALGHGIYAVRARIMGEAAMHDAVAYLGTRPTFDDGQPVLEVYLFDFKGDLYGHDLEVAFVDFIRPDRKFDSVAALAAQMAADCAQTRAILAG